MSTTSKEEPMWIQLYGESINLNNVSRFWLEQDRSSDGSIIPTLKIQLASHRPGEWLEFEIRSNGEDGKSSIEIAEEALEELRSAIGQHVVL